MSDSVITTELVEAIQGDGIAACQVSDDAPGYREVLALGHQHFVSDRFSTAYREFESGTRKEGNKPFLVKYRETEKWQATDPIIRFALSDAILPIVAACFGENPILYSADVWAILPSLGKQRVLSQNWHRDPETERMIKVFLYLVDADMDAGPFRYVLGSHKDYFELCEAGKYYPAENADRFPKERARVFPGPQGTLLFAYTRGLHMGGYGSKLRLNAAWTFVTKDFPRRIFELSGELPTEATYEQRFALGMV